MIIDGKKIAEQILARTKVRALTLAHPPHVVALVGEETPATKSYLAIKGKRAADAGCLFETRPFPSDFSDADAVIIQLPLPLGIDTKKVCDDIPLEKDADALSTRAREKGELLAPVVAAVREIFLSTGFNPKDKKAVVLGSGWLVGHPASVWLREQGSDVTVLNSQSENLPDTLRSADIIISGTGSPHLIKPDMLKEGVVLIDAGTSESNGAIAGDADPACAPMCSIFTSVPGGVGPIAVACLFANAVTLASSHT